MNVSKRNIAIQIKKEMMQLRILKQLCNELDAKIDVQIKQCDALFYQFDNYKSDRNIILLEFARAE